MPKSMKGLNYSENIFAIYGGNQRKVVSMLCNCGKVASIIEGDDFYCATCALRFYKELHRIEDAQAAALKIVKKDPPHLPRRLEVKKPKPPKQRARQKDPTPEEIASTAAALREERSPSKVYA